MKKQILLFVLTLLPMLASAETVEIDGIWYVIKSGSNNTGVTKSPNHNYTGDIVIPSSITYNGVDYEVTSIVDGEYGNGAFESCNITSISLPNTIKRIGKRAFVYCINIKSIDIPYGVTSIGEAAFYASGLSSVTIPSSVTTL